MPAPTKDEIKAALDEISSDSNNYDYLLALIKQKERDPYKLLSASGAAIQEARRDVSELLPVITQTASAIKDGIDTTEFKMASTFGKILTIVMLLAPVADGVVAYIDAGHFGTGMIVSAVAAALKTLVTISYINSRKEIKVAASASSTQSQSTSTQVTV